MGPQLDSCGRGNPLADAAGLPPVASMGPQLDSCGRETLDKEQYETDNGLQWGRNLTVAEGLASTSRAAA